MDKLFVDLLQDVLQDLQDLHTTLVYEGKEELALSLAQSLTDIRISQALENTLDEEDLMELLEWLQALDALWYRTFLKKDPPRVTGLEDLSLYELQLGAYQSTPEATVLLVAPLSDVVSDPMIDTLETTFGESTVNRVLEQVPVLVTEGNPNSAQSRADFIAGVPGQTAIELYYEFAQPGETPRDFLFNNLTAILALFHEAVHAALTIAGPLEYTLPEQEDPWMEDFAEIQAMSEEMNLLERAGLSPEEVKEVISLYHATALESQKNLSNISVDEIVSALWDNRHLYYTSEKT